jgi:hypothetical protein
MSRLTVILAILVSTVPNSAESVKMASAHVYSRPNTSATGNYGKDPACVHGFVTSWLRPCLGYLLDTMYSREVLVCLHDDFVLPVSVSCC